ncbi:sensory box histidine kinase [Desulfocucumis palustris]|uniref:histidine kinase n=2 Tax=Desulfocucumis palustris TaxID=1898651 RepID=A0A2L2XEV7_9FIRM|nr:sensory box histidine kinase [Desulfocucumis palustris]
MEAGITKQTRKITKRRRIKKELAAGWNKFKSILNAMDDGVCLLSGNYDIEYINPVLEREFGPVNGRKCYEYFNGGREICQWCRNNDVLAGEPVYWKWHSAKTDKTYSIHDTSVVTGKGFSRLKLFHDVTDQEYIKKILKNYQKELRSLAAELSIVEERERRSVAADIHDNIGQSLAAAKIKLGLLKQSQLPLGVTGNIDQIAMFIDEAINYTQSLITNLSLPTLNDVDFSEALEWLCNQFQERHRIPISFEKQMEIAPIKDETRVILFKCVRELLNNIVKHSNAGKARVTVGKYEITVEDDGVGFDITQLKKKFGSAGGFGLFSVRERLHHLGGHMTIKSSRGNGTLIALKAWRQ